MFRHLQRSEPQPWKNTGLCTRRCRTMAIEAMKGAGMSYAGSSSASDVKAESQAKVETASNAAASDDLMKKTIQIDTKETDKNGKDGNRDDSQAKQTISENSQIKKAVDEINKKAHNSEAVFGIHDATNRVTIKIVDKDTKKVLKEYPPEKTLDMIAKVWEMAGLLVDKKL